MSLLLTGVRVCKGVALGKAYVMTQGQPDIPEYTVPDFLLDDEVDRYNQAIKQVRKKLYAVKDLINERVSGDITEFIEPHILTLNENAIKRVPANIIRREKINAEWALKRQRDILLNIMEDSNEPLLQTRKDDMMHVIDQVLLVLKQQGIDPIEDALGEDDETATKRILVVDRLSISELTLLNIKNIGGFISEHDAPNSHTAIMARSLDIPAITAVNGAHRYIKAGEQLILDGKYGMVCVNPDEKSIAHYKDLELDIAKYKANLGLLRSRPAITQDNHKITLSANVELQSDLDEIAKTGAEAVGLYRTEHLYLNREDLPSEDEQFDVYKKMLAQLDGIPINIRTLDIGADKEIPGISLQRANANPMLGLRSIRLSLENLKLFEPQIRAILRASMHGDVGIILPMISTYDELVKSQKIIEKNRQHLIADGLEIKPIKIGIMIETPAAAIMVDFFARHADFITVGTNDLTQFILAIDRSDEQVSYLFDNANPALIKILYNIIKTCTELDKPVLVCGEMAGNRKFTRLLMGMGLTNFSVMPSQLLEIKKKIRDSKFADAKVFVQEIIKTSNPEQVNRLIDKLNQ